MSSDEKVDVNDASNRPYIGGQAVIEGVMMRAPKCMSIAVRRPDGSIVIQEKSFQSKIANSKLWKLPAFRGMAVLVESFSLGYKALTFSAEQQMTDEEKEKMSGGSGKAMMIFSTLFALFIFIALPQLFAAGTGKLFGVDFALQDPRFHFVIGGFKLLVLLVYLVSISRIPDIRRVFQYHGAEHKTIYAYEKKLPLTVENVKAQSTLHPRCGTTFIVVVVLVSILVGSVVTPLLLPNAEGLSGQLLTLLLRIGMLPFIASISYELQRLSARFCTTGPLRVFLWPGFLVQKITTREPDEDQIEIAIAAMQAAEWREQANEDTPQGDVLEFENFGGFTQALPNLRSLALPSDNLSADDLQGTATA